MPDKIKHFYEFGDFRLDAENPGLWRAGKSVSISPKALELLILLVENHGELVTRDELLETVWKDTFVEEGNINYTISLLRKILENKNLIQTVPRRGYRFDADVRETTQNGKPKAAPEAESPEVQTVQPKSAAVKSSIRWVLAAIFLVSLVFVSGFAIWWRGDSANKFKSPESRNAEAMQAYTRGKMIIGKRGVEDREEKAIDEFQKAITLDPTFALAYAGLAEGYGTLAVKLSNQHSQDAYAKAKVAAEKALALDATLAEGFLIRGWLKRNADWDWQGAETDLRRSIEINPKDAIAHLRLAQTLCSMGKLDEALAENKTAYELDPISDFVLGGRFPILEARREYDTALKESEEFMRENKSNLNAPRAFATFAYHKEDYAKVIELGEQALANENQKNAFAWLSLVAASYQQAGQPEKAYVTLQKLEDLSENNTKALYSLAMNYAEIGRTDEAIATLQKCFEKHEERMSWLKVEPRFTNLQNDLRFQELLQKMNLN